MKIISLNAWGGMVGAEELIEFFKKHQDVDVFCLQEIFNGGENDPAEVAERIALKVYDLLSRIKNALPQHESYFRPQLKEHYGLAMFVKKDIQVLEEGEKFVHKEKGYNPGNTLGRHARSIQYIKTRHNDSDLHIINFHGLWNGMGKTDTEDRIVQSKNIATFIQSLKNEVVFCGDFNLRPDTQSLKIIEDTGLINLIQKYGILSTRTSHYTKDEKFADYAFVTQGIEVKDFKVLPDEVSDHAPLFMVI